MNQGHSYNGILNWCHLVHLFGIFLLHALMLKMAQEEAGQILDALHCEICELWGGKKLASVAGFT